MILKPLDKEYKLVTLGVTSIESALHQPDFMATPEQLYEAAMMWHASWSIIQHTAFDKDKWIVVNDMYISMLEHLQNSPSQKSQTFYKNLVEWNFITIWTRYNIVATECPLYLRVECWKYLVFIQSWWFDMRWVADDGATIIYDNKLYSKYFNDYNKQNLGTIYKNSDKEKEILTKAYAWPIYTVQEILQTDLCKKIQRWAYPLMVGFGDKDYMYFQYNVIVKNEAKTKNLMPNVQEIRIKITKQEAEQLMKNTLVNVFKFHFDVENNCLIDNKN